MTTSQTETLNRKARIFQRLDSGATPRSIADEERVCLQYVYRIALDNGIRRKAIAPTPEERRWARIHANLDRWNAEHGRVPRGASDILRYLSVADLVILTVPGRAPAYVVETTEWRASA